MVKKQTNTRLLTEEYLDAKLADYATKADLDFNTKEIISSVKEMFGYQEKILLSIREEVKGIKFETRKHVVRLDHHEVRIEALEKATN